MFVLQVGDTVFNKQVSRGAFEAVAKEILIRPGWFVTSQIKT